MRTASRFILGLVATGGFATAACAEEINATLVSGYPPVFLWVKHLSETFIPSVDAALEGTQYTMAWTEAYGGTLAAVGGELEAIEDGLAEIGGVPTVFHPTGLPLQNVTYFTPFGAADTKLIVEVIDQLHNDIPEMAESWHAYSAEYLGGGFTIENYFLMTSFPIESLDDLKGRRIGAPGPAVNWLEGTGAVGVAANLTTYYNDLQTGVFDGVIAFPTAAAPARLQEVAPEITVTDFGAQYGGSLVANKPWFDAQPEAVQEALREGARAFTRAYVEEQNQLMDTAMNALAEGGGQVTSLPIEERIRWANALPDVASAWAEDADGRGLPGSEVLDAYIAALKKAGVELPRDWSDR